MAPPHDELEVLKAQVAALTARVYRLEQASEIASHEAGAEIPVRAAQEVASPPSAPPVQPLPGTMLVPPAKSPASGSSAPTSHSAQSAQKPGPALKLPALSASARGNNNIEEKIGQYWLNRVGIVAILIGVSYFLKYAFENNWIGPAGRIAIGLLAGMGLVLWSERFRDRGYAAFSYSLKAVGIGALYLSLWGGYQVYHLIPSFAAFAAMIFVTAATMILAWSQDAMVLASFALIGGFATPALLSTGENHEVVLFTYVGLLDLANLAMATLKPWRRLLWGSALGTVLLYAG